MKTLKHIIQEGLFDHSSKDYWNDSLLSHSLRVSYVDGRTVYVTPTQKNNVLNTYDMEVFTKNMQKIGATALKIDTSKTQNNTFVIHMKTNCDFNNITIDCEEVCVWCEDMNLVMKNISFMCERFTQVRSCKFENVSIKCGKYDIYSAYYLPKNKNCKFDMDEMWFDFRGVKSGKYESQIKKFKNLILKTQNPTLREVFIGLDLQNHLNEPLGDLEKIIKYDNSWKNIPKFGFRYPAEYNIGFYRIWLSQKNNELEIIKYEHS